MNVKCTGSSLWTTKKHRQRSPAAVVTFPLSNCREYIVRPAATRRVNISHRGTYYYNLPYNIIVARTDCRF